MHKFGAAVLICIISACGPRKVSTNQAPVAPVPAASTPQSIAAPSDNQQRLTDAQRIEQQISMLQHELANAQETLRRLQAQPLETEIYRSLSGALSTLEQAIPGLSTQLAALRTQLSTLTDQEAKLLDSDQQALQQMTAEVQALNTAEKQQAILAVQEVQIKAQAAASQSLRESLNDYVPCIFNVDAENAFLQGNTTILVEKGSVEKVKEAVSNNPGVLNPSPRAKQDFFSILETTSNAFDAITKGITAGDVKAEAGPGLAQAATPEVKAPGDVGCSQSILTWDETRLNFGRKVADTYVAIQVTARNLNPNQEFLIHDLQVAVGAFSGGASSDGKPGTPSPPSAIQKPTGSQPCEHEQFVPTHFAAGHDRALVSGVALAGQAMTPRNVTERVLQLIASIAGSAATVAGGPSFSPAVHVFSATAVPGFSKIFPDLTIDQIQRLNALGFTSATAYKIVIPKSGTVPMTTFLPSAIFAEKLHGAPQSTRNWSHKLPVESATNYPWISPGIHRVL